MSVRSGGATYSKTLSHSGVEEMVSWLENFSGKCEGWNLNTQNLGSLIHYSKQRWDPWSKLASQTRDNSNLWVQLRKPVSVKKKMEADIYIHLNMYTHTHICLNMYTHRGTCSQINKYINEGRVLFKEGSGWQLWTST